MESVVTRPYIKPRGLTRLFVWTWADLNLICFFALSSICILNLNAVLRLTLGIPRAASLFIMLAAIASFLTARLPLRQAAGGVGMAFLTFMVYYMVVASVTGLDNDTLWFHFQQNLGVFVITGAAIVTGWRQAQREKLDVVLLLFYLIWLASVCSIFFSSNLRQLSTDFGTASRDSGFFTNPNHAGTVAGITFAIGFALLRTGRFTPLIVAGLALTSICTLRTFSKMAILMTVSVALFQVFSGTSKRNRYRVILLALVTLTSVIWLLTTGIELLDWNSVQLQRLLEVRDILVNQELNEKTTTSRTYLLQVGLKKFFDHPFFGQGLGTFHAMPEAAGFGTHNTYLMVAGEAGILALVLMIAFIYKWLRASMACDYMVLRQLCLNFILVFCMAGLSTHVLLTFRFENLMVGFTIGMLTGRLAYQKRINQEAQAQTVTPAS